MARFQTAGVLINRTAIACGLNKEADPFFSVDPAFIQLIELANQLGESLIHERTWQFLERGTEFITQAGDTGIYDLPADFAYMIDQTAWQKGDPGAAYPLLGPASPQLWSYLTASQMYNVTIYAWFRQAEGKLQLFPQPPPVGIPVQYRYMSRNWVQDGQSPPEAPVFKDTVSTYSDLVLFDPLLFVKGLRLLFLGAKGFDTTKAQDEYMTALDAIASHDAPAPVLNAALGTQGFRYRFLDNFTNVPQTGYGS